jgi:tetratricopeptide (TPR) repeat protein
MTTRSETFGRLLKAGISSIAYCEGKTAQAVEMDLGEQLGIAGYTVQRYKTGYLPPDVKTVRTLAEACVRRGLLGREWLQKFLHAAHYPHPEALVQELQPAAAPERQRTPRPYSNLPAPTYSRFVMREQAFREVREGLRMRGAVVLISSMGGMGKTSLAREVAEQALDEQDEGPGFGAVVWVSDKDRPGTVNLGLVLDEVARVLDYPGLAQLAHREKRFEVEQLLRRMQVLLVVDNFETITDSALLEWLLHLPEPSKALITTREFRREFRSSWPVDLHGLTEPEALALIAERLRVLGLEALAPAPAELLPLIEVTGGNPKALELATGLLKYERRSLPEVVAALRAARTDLFDDLFGRAWLLLGGLARQVLLALTLFPADVGRDALETAAGVAGADFEQAVERLEDLSLVDVQRSSLSAPVRYTLHPLVRVFARQQMAAWPAFAEASRARWLDWCVRLVSQIGFCWDDLSRLGLLDQDHETVYAAIRWCAEQRHDPGTLALIEGVRYYYTVRGMWDERLMINLVRAEAARRLGDRSAEAMSLAYHIEICCKQANLEGAAQHLGRLRELAAAPGLPGLVRYEIGYAEGIYAHARGAYAEAEQIWRGQLELARGLDGQKSVIARRWLARCRSAQGDTAGAQQLYRESLADARRIGDQRSVMGNTLKLAAFDLEQGRFAEALQQLETCRALAERFQDRRRQAECHLLLARLHRAQGDRAAARGALETALDLFERLGMRQDLDEARALEAEL